MRRKRKDVRKVSVTFRTTTLLRVRDYAELFGIAPNRAIETLVTERLDTIERSATYRRRQEAVERRVARALESPDWHTSGLLKRGAERP